MKLFHPDQPLKSQEHRAIFARYELLRTLVDFTAAFLFVVGSAMFFSPTTTYAGTWMFFVGSLCFAAKPTIKLVRELQLARLSRPVQPDHNPSE